jgi:hypothetical protein
MCSEIDARTRDNPESAMVNRPTTLELQAQYMQNQNASAAWPWPIGVNQCGEHNAFLKRLQKEREKSHEKTEPPLETFDSAAHRAFMRSLG